VLVHLGYMSHLLVAQREVEDVDILRHAHHTTTDICQIALTNEILSVRIRLALGPLGVQGVTFVAEPSAELIDLLL